VILRASPSSPTLRQHLNAHASDWFDLVERGPCQQLVHLGLEFDFSGLHSLVVHGLVLARVGAQLDTWVFDRDPAAGSPPAAIA
jgi:hypothetical protein